MKRNAGTLSMLFSPAVLLLACQSMSFAQEALKAEYQHSFEGKPECPPNGVLFGLSPANCVKFKPAGLRITLPAGTVGERPGTGLLLNLRIRGDFEITVDFEILQQPEPADSGSQTRFSLVAPLQKPRANLAALSWRVAKAGTQFLSWANLWHDEARKSQVYVNGAATSAESGRLRLTRVGSELHYYAAEGKDDFTLLQRFPYGPEDLHDIRLIASTGGPAAAFDVLVRRLHVRAEAVEPGAQTKKMSAMYAHSFKDRQMSPGGKLYGPRADQRVQLEAAGLRINLPQGEHLPTGVLLPLKVHGDFEISASYEIVSEPAPEDSPKPTRFSLAFYLDKPKENLASMSRTVNKERGSLFGTWQTLWDEVLEKPSGRIDTFPTASKSGRLRLRRTAADLEFYAAEGPQGEFCMLQKYPYSMEDLQDVRLVATTGGPRAHLDVRVFDLSVRAESLSNVPAGVQTALTGEVPLPERGRSLLWLLIAAGIAFAAVAGVTLLRVLRRRTPAPAATREKMVVRCPHCNKALKLGTRSSGARIRCPGCTATFVA